VSRRMARPPGGDMVLVSNSCLSVLLGFLLTFVFSDPPFPTRSITASFAQLWNGR
jgi:hypothetical protein